MSDDPISFDHLSSLDPKKLEIIKFVISSCHGKPLELILPQTLWRLQAVFQNKVFLLQTKKFP